MNKYRLYWSYELTDYVEHPGYRHDFQAESDEKAAKFARERIDKERATLDKSHTRYTNFGSSLIRYTEVQVQF